MRPLLLDIEKGRSSRVLPPLLELPKFSQKGTGPRRQSHPLPKTVPLASWCGVRDLGPTYLPSRPAGLSEVQAEKSSGEGQDRVRGGDKISNLASKQNKFKETKLLFVQQLLLTNSRQGAFNHSGWPSKKLGITGAWPPSGQCTELRKVSLHDTGEGQVLHLPYMPWALTSHPP